MVRGIAGVDKTVQNADKSTDRGRNTGRSLEQLSSLLKRYLTGWKKLLQAEPEAIADARAERMDKAQSRRKQGPCRQTAGSCHKEWRISCSPALNIALPIICSPDWVCQKYRQATINITEPPYTAHTYGGGGRKLIVRSALSRFNRQSPQNARPGACTLAYWHDLSGHHS